MGNEHTFEYLSRIALVSTILRFFSVFIMELFVMTCVFGMLIYCLMTPGADKIVVMDEGVVAEEGTHEDTLRPLRWWSQGA